MLVINVLSMIQWLESGYFALEKPIGLSDYEAAIEDIKTIVFSGKPVHV